MAYLYYKLFEHEFKDDYLIINSFICNFATQSNKNTKKSVEPCICVKCFWIFKYLYDTAVFKVQLNILILFVLNNFQILNS